MKTTAIIPAAGSGTRMGKHPSATPPPSLQKRASKLFLMLGDMPVLAHTLLAFDRASEVDEVIVAAREDDILLIWDMISEFGITKVSKIINGGSSRSESVRAAILEVSDDTSIIAIHDGARPLIAPKLIDTAIAEAARKGAVTLAVPVKDTIKRVSANGVIEETLERDSLYQIQTPQVFRAELIKEAYEQELQSSVSYADSSFQKEPLTANDDCELVESLGVAVHIVKGDYANIKITTTEDIAIAEGLIL